MHCALPPDIAGFQPAHGAVSPIVLYGRVCAHIPSPQPTSVARAAEALGFRATPNITGWVWTPGTPVSAPGASDTCLS